MALEVNLMYFGAPKAALRTFRRGHLQAMRLVVAGNLGKPGRLLLRCFGGVLELPRLLLGDSKSSSGELLEAAWGFKSLARRALGGSLSREVLERLWRYVGGVLESP